MNRLVSSEYKRNTAIFGTKYVTEEGYNGFSRWQIGIGHFRFRNMTLRYYIGSEISLIIVA